MDWRSVILAFLAGFVLATIIGLAAVLPMVRDAARVNTDSDVHRPLAGALEYIEQSASTGDCAKAATQLRLLNKRFAEYRERTGAHALV
jgi:hypothetical protein